MLRLISDRSKTMQIITLSLIRHRKKTLMFSPEYIKINEKNTLILQTEKLTAAPAS